MEILQDGPIAEPCHDVTASHPHCAIDNKDGNKIDDQVENDIKDGKTVEIKEMDITEEVIVVANALDSIVAANEIVSVLKEICCTSKECRDGQEIE